MKRKFKITFCLILAMIPLRLFALVNYDEGQRLINGVQLLQNASNDSLYHYVPQFPRVASKADGTLELLCLKYIDATGSSSGGLLHALVEFTLPDEVVKELEKVLEKQVAGARIAGPVPLLQAIEDGEEGMGSFQLVSALLADQSEGGFTRSVITSGKAPLAPGSKAVVAAILNPQGATLLWDSLTGSTSDVSVAINAYYEAAVKAYNARVTAEVETVYSHFSRLHNVQKDFTRRQLRKIVDDLQRKGDLKVEVLDRTQGLNIKAEDMKGILNVVTDKLIELMFDHESGWAKDPEREVAVEAKQIQGRQRRGWFSRVFGGTQDTKYYTDDQYVLKKRKDVRRNVFTINLGMSSTIKVPVNTAGNLGGLYGALGDDKRYFRIVNLEDPAFQIHEVHFQIDGGYLDSFQHAVNFVSVNFRKRYPSRPAFTRPLSFTHEDVKAGKTIQSISFPRLGIQEPEWHAYEYQVRWSLRDGPVISLPTKEDEWISSRDAIVALVPPFKKQVVEVDADRGLFRERGYSTALLDFATVLGGKTKRQRGAALRVNDANPTSLVSLYHDRGEPIAYRVTWHSTKLSIDEELKLLDTDYLFIVPPVPQPDDSLDDEGSS